MEAALEHRLLQMEQQMRAVDAAFMEATRRETVLQAEVIRLSAASGSTAPAPKSSIDTRTLGKPDNFNGEAGKWSDWKTVMTAYCSVLSERLGQLMQSLEEGTVSNLRRATLSGQDPALSSQLYYILVMITRQQALTLVTNSGPQEGFLAWQRLIEHFEPTAKTRQAGQLLSLLSWNFSHGDVQNQMELFDAAAHKYEQRSADTLSDAMRVGIALRQMEDGPLRQHLLLNGSRLNVWKDFKSEITDVLRAMAAVGPTPMDVGALFKGGKSGGKGSKGSGKGASLKDTCRNCGKPGHYAKECWAPCGGGAAGKGGKASSSKGSGKPGKGGKAGGKTTGKDVKCWTCGKMGHVSSACRSKNLNSVEAAAGSAGADAGAGVSDENVNALYLNVLEDGGDDDAHYSGGPSMYDQHQEMHDLWSGAEDDSEYEDLCPL